jgi:hypothetical protein
MAPSAPSVAQIAHNRPSRTACRPGGPHDHSRQHKARGDQEQRLVKRRGGPSTESYGTPSPDISKVSRSGAAASRPPASGNVRAGSATVVLSDRSTARDSPGPTRKWEIAEAIKEPAGGDCGKGVTGAGVEVVRWTPNRRRSPRLAYDIRIRA